ncbi:hypothetical protein GJAV_G00148160 [Gymnothorax javanicus]|nr:hypothetical protein GJAV_G00148160 [Gymnothorax javanicus]
MDNVIGKLKAHMPTLNTVSFRQDNAGCYRCGATIVGAPKTGQPHGVPVKRLDFCDPQGGKGSCDRKAASIKAHMTIQLNEGHDIDTGQYIVNAMTSAGDVAGLNITLSDALPSAPLSVRLDGVSFISNVEYGQRSIRIWKAYNIGPGKSIDLMKINKAQSLAIPPLSTKRDEGLECFSRPRASVSTGKAKTTIEAVSMIESNLFCCPEEGCVKSYQRLSSLQQHVDCGKQERRLENQMMLDRAALGYASELQWQSTSAPHSPFTEKQKENLATKFQIGKTTRRKCDPAVVAKSMIDQSVRQQCLPCSAHSGYCLCHVLSRFPSKPSSHVHFHSLDVSCGFTDGRQ